jgi:hypothetical protein
MQTDNRESVSTPTIPPQPDEVAVLIDNQMNGMVEAFVICYLGQVFSKRKSCDIQTISATWMYFPRNGVLARDLRLGKAKK